MRRAVRRPAKQRQRHNDDDENNNTMDHHHHRNVSGVSGGVRNSRNNSQVRPASKSLSIVSAAGRGSS